ncbi:MAG: dihydroorotate dehydrogenase-like protein [Bacteroidota bacterium]
MANLETKYLGISLNNPIIAASSGLTNSIKDIKEFEENGAGAVVLKSIFEEEILLELEKDQSAMNRESFLFPETVDFFDDMASDDAYTEHLKLIREAKKEVSIPIIASVNCVSAEKWPAYAQNLQDAGADAIELNVFVMPSDFNRTCDENEKLYFQIVEEVKKYVQIPVALKISFYSSNLGSLIQQLSHSGIDGLVLFNRFYSPDIDINNFNLLSSHVLSHPGEIAMPLRWIGIMADRAECDLAASTGIHDGDAVIKQLLAGAKTVQVASTIYKNGKKQIKAMLQDIENWMEQKGYNTLDDFRGKLTQMKTENPAAYYRMQFMKHFAGKGY